MKFNFTTLIQLSFLMIGCHSTNAQWNELDEVYSDGIKKFQAEFIDHFPKTIVAQESSVLVSEDISITHKKIWLKTHYSSKELDSLISYVTLKAKSIYHSDDSCLLVIDSHLTNENYLKYDKSLRVSPNVNVSTPNCSIGYFPVPKFWKNKWFETGKTKIGLDTTYVIYIIDSKPGVFAETKELTNGKYTPSGWEHGYSKGVAIDKARESVLFWFDIW